MSESAARERYTFLCWQCKETYEITLPVLVAGQKVPLECPFCGAEAVFDPAPYQKPVVDAIRSVDDSSQRTELALPDVLPTSPE